MSKLVDVLKDTVNSFSAWFTTTVKQTTESYCALETADDTHTFAGHDGSLASIIRIEGATQLIGQKELDYIHEKLTYNLQRVMAQPGHTLQLVFHNDPRQAKEHLEDLLAPSYETANNLDLRLKDLIQEKIQTLANYSRYESVYLVLWTHPSNLNKAERDKAEKDKLQLIREKQLKPFRLTQNIIAAIPLLRNTHDMFVQSVLQTFTSLSIQCHLLEVHEAAWHIRQLADPEFTDTSWRACLPGDQVPLKAYPKYQETLCDILWPSLARQLLPRDAENIDLRSTRLGDRIYTCLFVDLLSKEVKEFTALLRHTIAADIPWRISFLSESDSLHKLKFKSLLATFLSFSSKENRLLSDANNLLDYIATHSDEAIIQLKIVVSTWAAEGQMDLLRRRSAALARAIQSWGVSEISEVAGDPFEGLIATLPALASKSIATPTLLPCSSMVRLLPLARPASPWKIGAQLFRTPDGKIFPFQPGSSLQISWIDLIYARPGAGKSVLSNTLNLAACLKAGLTQLPYIAILDIGPSSKGLISLLQEALPPHQKHQVAYCALQMSEHYTINPFDTQLGARYPTQQERSFLINLLTLLATPLEEESAYDGIADMAGLIVDELYKQLSDHEKPTVYTPHLEPHIDGLIHTLNIPLDKKTTWWEITDSLFQHGYIKEATRAQRHAMPLLADVAAIIRTPIVSDLYGHIKTRTNESLIHAFTRILSRAIREYPILSGVTQFDIGPAKILALDLEAVTKSGGPAADRQTAIMYMLARYLLTKNCYPDETLLDNIAKSYHRYHQDRMQTIKESTKRLVFDEFHRTGRSPMVRRQIINDMREGRKHNIQIALISQSLDDFDTTMVEFATTTYILDAGSVQTIEKSVQTFGLSQTAYMLLRQNLHGPQPSGVNFLAQFSTTLGVNTQLLTLTLSPQELWALTTSAEDVLLRDKLYHTLGPEAARAALAQQFPQGTIRPTLEARSWFSTDQTQQHIDRKESMINALYVEILESMKQPNSSKDTPS